MARWHWLWQPQAVTCFIKCYWGNGVLISPITFELAGKWPWNITSFAQPFFFFLNICIWIPLEGTSIIPFSLQKQIFIIFSSHLTVWFLRQEFWKSTTSVLKGMYLRMVTTDHWANVKGSRNVQDSHIAVQGYLVAQEIHYLKLCWLLGLLVPFNNP